MCTLNRFPYFFSSQVQAFATSPVWTLRTKTIMLVQLLTVIKDVVKILSSCLNLSSIGSLWKTMLHMIKRKKRLYRQK